MEINLEKYLEFHSPSYVIEIYNKGKEQEIVVGNRQTKPIIRRCNSNTLYDIASLTKVYTATLIYIAYEENKINIYEFVNKIDDRFMNLNDIRIIDLLSHNQEIWTDGYLGSAKDKEEFYKILFTASVKDNYPTYVDSHYIILSTILERVYNKPYDKILKEKIFDKLNLKATTTEPMGENIVSNNYETLNDKVIDYITPGLIHDTKGRIAKELGIITGHASIFTTGKELLIFLKSFLDYSLLKKETIDLMLKHNDINKLNFDKLSKLVSINDINTMYEEALKANQKLKMSKTYNYMGTRYKNLIEDLNDVPYICSDNSVAFSGYTGPMFVIDFDNKVIVVVMCNVMHNTKIERTKRKKTTELIMNEICNLIYNNKKISNE